MLLVLVTTFPQLKRKLISNFSSQQWSIKCNRSPTQDIQFEGLFEFERPQKIPYAFEFDGSGSRLLGFRLDIFTFGCGNSSGC